MTTFSIAQADGKGDSPDITTNYDAIVETDYKSDLSVEYGLQEKNSDLCTNIFKK